MRLQVGERLDGAAQIITMWAGVVDSAVDL
jgi:hypothetical protein